MSMLLRSSYGGVRALCRASPVINAPIRACIHANICEIDSELRSDVKKLGKALGVAIKQNDSKVFNIVEELRALGREVCKFSLHRFNRILTSYSILCDYSGDCPTGELRL